MIHNSHRDDPLGSSAAVDPARHRMWPLPASAWRVRMRWHDLLFIHWPVDADCLRRLIPESLKLDTHDGVAWLGIVPFRMSDVAPRGVPALPWLSAFPELNVRTYVTADGKPGVWFFSLDATNPVAVRVARMAFRLPYFDARISIHEDEQGWFQYRSQRQGRVSADFEAAYRPIGGPYVSQPGTLEHWLTARYCLYAADRQGRTLRGEIDHPPWPLQNAEAVVRKNTLTDWLDIDLPADEPILHFSRDLRVVAWTNRRVAPPE